MRSDSPPSGSLHGDSTGPNSPGSASPAGAGGGGAGGGGAGDHVHDRLRATAGFVFDLDGTLVLTDRLGTGFAPLPGALAITRWLTAMRVPFVLFTNGTGRTPASYAGALADAGFCLREDMVLTPAVSAAHLFARRGYQRVMVLGNEGLALPLREAGLEVVPPARDTQADAVLAGLYREFTLDALEAACHAVWQGAEFFSCSQSVFFATAEGRALGTSRAISAMVRSVTGCRVEIVGKPSMHALRTAARRLKLQPASLAVVGDDPELEVPMAHKGKALAVGVGTGIGAASDFAALPAGRRPHLMLPGVDRLLDLCRAVTADSRAG